MNPLMNFMKQKINPHQLLMQMLGNNPSPNISKLVQFAKNNDVDGLKNAARELLQKEGRDFDKEFEEFMTNMK